MIKGFLKSDINKNLKNNAGVCTEVNRAACEFESRGAAIIAEKKITVASPVQDKNSYVIFFVVYLT